MDTVRLEAKGISVTLDLAVGHIADMVVEAGGRRLRPLHRAPWIDEPPEGFPPGLPEGTRRLSGDFLCAPFSRSDVEEAPLHGWSANSPWDLIEDEPIADGRRATFRLRRRIMGATVDKVLTLRDGHPFLYQEHVFAGGAGALPVAHHPMTVMREGGRLAFSPKRFAATPPDALEPDASRGRYLLAYPARSADLAHFPAANGGDYDLTRYRSDGRHEDFVTLVEADHGGPGWTAVARRAERDLVLVLKDPAELPITMLWISNGGRDYAPWSGRHRGVIGIEGVLRAGTVAAAAPVAAPAPYHSLTPLWPRQAPFFEAPEYQLPSLHRPVVPAGALADAVALVAFADGAGAAFGAAAVAAAPPYHSLTPLWPRQAPFFEAPEV